MKKPKYIIVQDGEPIRTSNYIPIELITREYAPYVWIIRLKDLHHYWMGEWYPLKEIEIAKLF